MALLKSLQEMKQRHADVVAEMRTLVESADKENRGMTDEENTKYDSLDKELDLLKSSIQKREKLDAEEARLSAEDAQNTSENREKGHASGGKNGIESAEYREAFRQFIVDPTQINPEQRNLLLEKRALSAVTGASGGYTVSEDFYNKLVDAMQHFGGMRQVSNVFSTTTGADLPIPTANDTASEGELLGENTTATTGDISFGQIIMKAYKYSSKVVLVPFELLQDSAFDIETYIARKLGERLGRITNKHFTVGDNSSKPQGVVTGATLGKLGAAGQTTSVTYDDLVDLTHSVDIVYRKDAKFMLNDSTLKAIKKLKDSQGLPLWSRGMTEKEPSTILGYPYQINNDIPTMAASAKSILFGNFENYFIRDVKDIQLYRISDKYIESGQVGFLAFYRGDARMVDAGTNPIKYYQNAAS